MYNVMHGKSIMFACSMNIHTYVRLRSDILAYIRYFLWNIL